MPETVTVVTPVGCLERPLVMSVARASNSRIVAFPAPGALASKLGTRQRRGDMVLDVLEETDSCR